MRLLRYLAWPVALGLSIAALVLWRLAPSAIEAEPTPLTGPRQPAPPFAEQRVSYAAAVRRAAPSVVNIYTRKLLPERRHPLLDDPFYRRFFDQSAQPQQQRMESSLGSGVIVSGEGYILTNDHVIAGADEIIVLLADGREAQARVVGVDRETDLAVLRVELPDLVAIPVGNSSQARVGDVVLAIGNPFGLGQSVSQGIVSAIGRGLGLNTYENFLQTDAAINRGNSGGALTDAYGNLIGINTAMLESGASQGISFAIPVKTAIKVLEDIVRHGHVVRGWLGVQVQQLPPQAAQALGLSPPGALAVIEVQPDSPAAAGGIRVGDVITHINGEPVLDGAYSTNLIADLKPGDPVRLRVLRGTHPLSLTTTAGTRPTLN
ncbi:MAG: trypsin-like peptidase domain-containing protein [Pseudomonadota bacterium]|jgi:serine protease DegS